MAASIELTTVADLKVFLKVSSSDCDTQFADIIAGVSQSIESYCKRKFKKEEVTEYYDGRSYGKLAIERPPIERGGTITIWTDGSIPRDYADGDKLEDTDYTINHKAGILTRVDGSWLSGDDAVKITYTGGESATTADLPEDLQQAAKIWCADIWAKAKEGGFGFESFRLGAYSAKYEHSVMPAEVKKKLAPYKDRKF